MLTERPTDLWVYACALRAGEVAGSFDRLLALQRLKACPAGSVDQWPVPEATVQTCGERHSRAGHAARADGPRYERDCHPCWLFFGLQGPSARHDRNDGASVVEQRDSPDEVPLRRGPDEVVLSYRLGSGAPSPARRLTSRRGVR